MLGKANYQKEINMNKFEYCVMSITKIQSPDKDEINIRLVDNVCTGKPLDIRVCLEDFSKAIFGDIHINCPHLGN